MPNAFIPHCSISPTRRSSSLHIAIVGVGALGTLFARKLLRDNHVVALERGSDPTEAAASEAVLVVVKAYATREAMTPLAGVLQPQCAIVTLQNGIDNLAAIREVVGGRVYAGVTTESATRTPHAIVRGGAGTTTLPDDAALDPLAVALAAAGFAVARTSDIERSLWSKLVANAAINPVTALAGVNNGALLEQPQLLERAIALARETAAVAAASGVAIDAEPAEIVETVARASAANRSSMLQDLEAGRRTEADAILGAVITRAGRFGLDTPAARRAYAEILARETPV